MSGRRSAAEALATRERLLKTASDLSTTEGLEGMSLARLADACGVSKSGVTRHFPSKVELQLHTLEHAFARFSDEVWGPAAAHPEGLERLRAVCTSWTDFLAGECFPGGCFLTAVSAEFDGRPGPVRDAIAAGLKRWLTTLAREAETARAAGDLLEATDPRSLVHELHGLALAANQARQVLGDDDAPARSCALMLDVLERHAR